MGTRLRVASCLILLAATAVGQGAVSVDELRAALKDATKRFDALDEIARYWEGRDELEPDVRALVATNWRAAWALGMKKTISDESMEALAKEASDPAARWALAQVGRPAMPLILQRLGHAEERDAMCQVLGRMGPAGRDAVHQLAAHALAGREEARTALAAMAPIGAPLLEHLIELDGAEDAELVCYVGPIAFSRLHRLAEKDDTLKNTIELTLSRLPYSMGFFLKSKPGRHHARGLEFLAARGMPELVAALPAEIQSLRTVWALPKTEREQAKLDGRMYLPALDTLAKIGLRDPDTVRWLANELSAGVPAAVTPLAVDALIRGDSPAGHAVLARFVTDTTFSGETRVRILAHLAERAPEALKPKLVSLVDDRSFTVRAHADLAAIALGSPAADPERFRSRFTNQLPLVKASILDMAAALNCVHKEVDAAIVEAGNSPSAPARASAIVALAHRGKVTADQHAWLVATARKPRGRFQSHAIRALARMPAEDRVALEGLLEVADTWNWHAVDAVRDRPGPILDDLIALNSAARFAVYMRGPRSAAELDIVTKELFAELRHYFSWIEPAPPTVREEARKRLSGDAPKCVRTAEFLAIQGTDDDIPALRRCLLDAKVELRIAAWDAIEAIEARAAR